MSAATSEARSGGRIVRDLAALVGAELVAKLAGFAAFAYLARVLTPEHYGGVELAIQLALALGMLVDFGLGPIGARAVAESASRAARVAREIATLRLLLACAAYAGAWLIAGAVDVRSDVRALIRVVALSLFAAPFVSSWLFQGLGNMAWVAGGQLLRMCVFAALCALLVRADEQLALVAVAELSAVFAMAGWYWIGQSRNVCRPGIGAPVVRLRALAAAALPVGLSRVGTSIQQYAPTLAVAQLAGPSELAWFAAAHRLVTSLGAFVEIQLFNLYPQLVRAAASGGAGLREAAAPSFRASAWIGCSAALAITLLAAPVLRLVFGAPFESAALLLAVASWALPLGLVGGHARFALLAVGAQRTELAATATGAALTLGAAWLLVPSFGSAAAAAALAAGAAATWFAAHLLARARGLQMPVAAGLRALAAGAAIALGNAAFPADGQLLRAALSLLLFAGAAAVFERELLRDARRLIRRGLA